MAKRKAARATGRAKASKRAKAKPTPRKVTAKRVARRKTSARGSQKTAAKRRKTARKAVARKAAPRQGPARSRQTAVARKVPALNRERRIVRDEDEDIVPTPPSSLDLDRSASAVRTGRRELSEKLHEHTETSPAITGGDIDADWESAYSVGDEAPGGDNPTPDQDIVDDIGRAIGVQYEDNEELKGEKKISDRDRKRWELDPASAEDYNEHDED
jgi:hypothetical protein